jgi:hypothetical protein
MGEQISLSETGEQPTLRRPFSPRETWSLHRTEKIVRKARNSEGQPRLSPDTGKASGRRATLEFLNFFPAKRRSGDERVNGDG